MNRRGFIGWLLSLPMVKEFVLTFAALEFEGLPDWVTTDEDGQWVLLNPVPYGVMFKQVTEREWTNA